MQILCRAGRLAAFGMEASKLGIARTAEAQYIVRVSLHDRRVGMPPQNRSQAVDIRRCSIRSRRAAGAFGQSPDFEPAERRGRPVQAGRPALG